MSYRYQLRDARNSLTLKSIAGLCTDSDDFVAILNEVMQRLMDRGNWFDTEQILQVCAYNGCITWPRIVGTVLGIRNCCMGDLEIRNNWWTIFGPRDCAAWHTDYTMRDANPGSFYNDISGCGTGKEIRIYITKLEDVGKRVTLYGLDSNNQPLQEKVNGVWQRGLSVVLASPYATTSPILINRLTIATKDITQGNILVYEYDTATGTQRDIALWEPSETNPLYRRSVINNFRCIPGCPESNGIQLRKFDALVKFEFIPVTVDSDFLAIDDFIALKFGIQAVRLEEANQDSAAEAKWFKSIQQMNFRDRNKSPGQQTTIRVNPVGHMIVSPY